MKSQSTLVEINISQCVQWLIVKTGMSTWKSRDYLFR